MHYFTYEHPFELENGGILPGVTVAYHTYGRLNADASNVVWVCHALTANSDVAHWWTGVVGEKGAIRPEEYFIVCANILGSCYGSTGPLSVDPGKAGRQPVPVSVDPGEAGRQPGPVSEDPGKAGRQPGPGGTGNGKAELQEGESYYADFPPVTIRDMVRAHMLLRQHLGIGKIHLLMGGSMGGYQALEWALMEKEVIGQLFLIATSPAESAWGIAVHTAQRMAIEADSSWRDANPEAGIRGLKAARAIGILTYRNYGIMVQKQTDPDAEKLDGFKAASYIEYQGDKLADRFFASCYWLLTKSMDSHNLSRGRGGDIEAVLKNISQRTLLIGITSDILCPVEEQRHMAAHLPDATLIEIDSAYGHDGFMVEGEKIANHLRDWLSVGGK